MPGFKKGNKFTFTCGSVPHNKKRTKPKHVKSDSKEPSYTRLTRKLHNLVVNDPYTSSEEKAKRSASAAKLLRPKSDNKSVPKNARKTAVKDKR